MHKFCGKGGNKNDRIYEKNRATRRETLVDAKNSGEPDGFRSRGGTLVHAACSGQCDRESGCGQGGDDHDERSRDERAGGRGARGQRRQQFQAFFSRSRSYCEPLFRDDDGGRREESDQFRRRSHLDQRYGQCGSRQQDRRQSLLRQCGRHDRRRVRRRECGQHPCHNADERRLRYASRQFVRRTLYGCAAIFFG